MNFQELGPSRMEEVELKLVPEGRGTSTKERRVYLRLEEATLHFLLLLTSRGLESYINVQRSN